MEVLKINLNNFSYDIYIENNVILKIGDYLKNNYTCKNIVVITDENVNNLYGEKLSNIINESGFHTEIIAIKPGEESKSLDCLAKLYEKLSNIKISREDLIITFGGGVVGDLGGFAASTYLRGIPFIQVPTSLLAQVDSSIGGKVAVNLPWGKNLVGSFYHPKAVFIDPELLKTLNRKYLHDGLAEVIKYGCIKDRSIIEKLLNFKDETELLANIKPIIYRCCNIKKAVVELDERDFGERMLLNFGHTLGHAIEKYYNYNKYTHGEAVAIGMAVITQNSELLNITDKGTTKQIIEVLKKYELPYNEASMEKSKILDSVSLDKKNSGENINLIILKEIGKGFIKKVNIREVEHYI